MDSKGCIDPEEDSMSSSALKPTRKEMTASMLEERGFTKDQIDQLIALKNVYPYPEFFDTAQQWKRLQFLKWRCATGRLRKGSNA